MDNYLFLDGQNGSGDLMCPSCSRSAANEQPGDIMKVQCPQCDQIFDAPDDFLGKTVECGACDNRFTVSEDEIFTEIKRFYPGEKDSALLEKFGNDTKNADSNVPIQTADYQQGDDVAYVGPQAARKTLAGVVGVLLMLVVIVTFVLGGGAEGALRDVETEGRFVVCGFAAILGSLLILYGSSRNRWGGVLLAIVLGVVLMAIPFFYPGNPVSTSSKPLLIAEDDAIEVIAESGLRTSDEYLVEVGYQPVANAIAKHPRETVVGVFLRDSSELVSAKISRYLYDVTGRVNRGIEYTRGQEAQSCLILLVEQTKSIHELAKLCDRFGKVQHVDAELRLIDVLVEKNKLSELKSKKVLNPDNPDYEIQNLMALQSFDPAEQIAAIKRLAASEPRALRNDITRQLVKMLPDSNPDMQQEIIRALHHVAQPGSGAGPQVLEVVKQLHTQGKVTKVAIEFLIANQVEGCEAILVDLWLENPVVWSSVMTQLGEGAEVLLLPIIKEMSAAQHAAASNILGNVGSPSCADYLEGLIQELDEKKRKSLQAAIDEIKKRS